MRIEGEDAGGAHGVRGREGRALGRQPQGVEAAGENLEAVDPDAVAVAVGLHGVELRAHETGEHDHAALRRTAARAPRRLIEARHALVAELRGQDFALFRAEGEERRAQRLELARGERAVEGGEARAVSIAGHGGRLSSACKSCQSAIGLRS